MIHGQSCIRKNGFKRCHQQKNERPAVNPHSIFITHRNWTDHRVNLDRISQFTQLAIYDSANNRDSTRIQNGFEEFADRGIARPAKNPAIWKMDFNRPAWIYLTVLADFSVKHLQPFLYLRNFPSIGEQIVSPFISAINFIVV